MERHAGGGLPGLRGADPGFEGIPDDRPAARTEDHRVSIHHRDQRGLVFERDALVPRLPRDRPVHGARIHVEEPEALRHAAGGRALPRPGGSVDREDERLQRKRPRSRFRNPGSLTRADSAPSTVTPSRAASPATMKAIAIRWSPAASTVPPRTRPARPWIVQPSG